MPRNRDAKNIIRQYMADHGVAYNEAARQLGYRDAPFETPFMPGAVVTHTGEAGFELLVRDRLNDGRTGWRASSNGLVAHTIEPIDLSDRIGELCEDGPQMITVYVPGATPEWLALRQVPSYEEIARQLLSDDDELIDLHGELLDGVFRERCEDTVRDRPVGTLITMAPGLGRVAEAALLTEVGWVSTLDACRFVADPEINPNAVTRVERSSEPPRKRVDYRYGIVLRDEIEHTVSVVTFLHAELWDWLHTVDDFGGASRIRTVIPGTGVEVSVTAGSAMNDRAQHIANGHPWLRTSLDPAMEFVVDELVAQVGADNVYEGLAY